MKEKLNAIASKLGSFTHIYYDANDSNKYYVTDADNKEIYHVYNSLISYKIENGEDIILYPDGKCKLPRREEKYDYQIDDNGNIICDIDGKVEIYNHNMFYTGDKDNNTYYEYDSSYQVRTKDGKVNYSKKNHIEYDEDSYHALMKNITNIGNNVIGNIASACSNISSICSSVSPEPIPCDTGSIMTVANAQRDALNNLNTAINYSLLAYDTCDTNLKELIDSNLINKLFENDIFLGEEFKYLVQNNIEDRDSDGILEYNKNTNFNELEKNITNSIKLDMKIDEEVENLKLWNFNMYNDDKLSKMSDIDVKKELYKIKNNYGEDGLNRILFVLKEECPKNFSVYQFNPGKQQYENDYYNYNPDTISNYETNSEIVTLKNILGGSYKFEIAQVLPKDCTNIERIAYDVVKANVLNTMRMAPGVMLNEGKLNTTSENEKYNRNLLVLTCDPKSQKTKFNEGYYWQNDWRDSGLMAINVGNISSYTSSIYYTKDLPIKLLATRFMPKVKDNYSYKQPYYNHYYEVKENIEKLKKKGEINNNINADTLYIDSITNFLTMNYSYSPERKINDKEVNGKYDDPVMKDIWRLFGFFRGCVAIGTNPIYRMDGVMKD